MQHKERDFLVAFGGFKKDPSNEVTWKPELLHYNNLLASVDIIIFVESNFSYTKYLLCLI